MVDRHRLRRAVTILNSGAIWRLIMTIQLSSIILGSSVVPVVSAGRLAPSEWAQCVCNVAVTDGDTRRLLEHHKLFQADSPHKSYQDFAVESGLWATWLTKAGKTKPVGCNERKAELRTLYGDHAKAMAESAEYRVLTVYDRVRVMHSADKTAQEADAKLARKGGEKPVEKTVADNETAVPTLPPLVQALHSVQTEAAKRLNQLISQVEMDDSLEWIASELKAIRDGLSSVKSQN